MSGSSIVENIRGLPSGPRLPSRPHVRRCRVVDVPKKTVKNLTVTPIILLVLSVFQGRSTLHVQSSSESIFFLTYTRAHTS